MSKIDLEKLRETVDNRKEQLNAKKAALGEKTVIPITGDQFLKELVHTRNTGQETGASIKIKTVDKLAESKITGKPVDSTILNHIPASTPTPTNNEKQSQPTMGAAEIARMEEAKRIRQMAENNYNKPLAQNNASVYDAISQYQNMPKVGSPMNNTNGMLTEQQVIAQGGTPQMIVEQVNNVATQFLNENFGHLYAEAMKNSIIESYKAEVVKKALEENRSVIEQIVRETIIDLQKRNQSKKQ